MCFNLNFTWIFSQGSSLQYYSVGADKGLAPNRRQAFTWINDGLVYVIHARISLANAIPSPHECVLSIVAINSYVLMHQAISIRSVE